MNRNNINKKAEFGTLVIIIILIVSGIILFIFASMVVDKGKESAEVEACRLSVLSQANTEVLGTSILSLECARRYITIYDTHVDMGLEPGKQKPIKVLYNSEYVKSFKAINPDIVNHVVAEEMRKCWYQFNAAKTEVFPNNEPAAEAWNIVDDVNDDICFTCAEINFDNKEDKQFSGVIEYLKSRYIKDQQYTYWQYFNQESLSEYTLERYIDVCNKNEIQYLWNDKPFVFGSKETYAIIFYKDYDQSDPLSDIVMNLIGPESENCWNTAGGKSGYHVLVLPTTHLGELCEIQAS